MRNSTNRSRASRHKANRDKRNPKVRGRLCSTTAQVRHGYRKDYNDAANNADNFTSSDWGGY